MGKSIHKLNKSDGQLTRTAQLTDLMEPFTFAPLPTLRQSELLDGFDANSLALHKNTIAMQLKPEHALIKMDSEDNVVAANGQSSVAKAADAIKAIRKNSIHINPQTNADEGPSAIGKTGVITSFPSANYGSPPKSAALSFATTVNKDGSIRLFQEPPRTFSGTFIDDSAAMPKFGLLSTIPAAIEHDSPSSTTTWPTFEFSQVGSKQTMDTSPFELKPRNGSEKPAILFSTTPTSSAAAPEPKSILSSHFSPDSNNISKIQSMLSTDPSAKKWFDTTVLEATRKPRTDQVQAAVHKTRLELEKGFVVEREKMNKKHEGQIKALKHSKKTGAQRESVLAYDLMAAYKSRQLENVQIIGSHKPLVLTAEEAVRLLSKQHQVGEEYRRQCHEALTMYKKELKRQYKDHLDDIEVESREWLRVHATGLTGEKLEAYFLKIFEAQLLNPEVPHIETDVVEALKPGSAECETMIGEGLQRVNDNFKALCDLNESVKDKYERDTNSDMQRRKPSARPSIMEPVFEPREKEATAENVANDKGSTSTVGNRNGFTVQEMMAATAAFAARSKPNTSTETTKLQSNQPLGTINYEHHRIAPSVLFAGASSPVNEAPVNSYHGGTSLSKRWREVNSEGSSDEEEGLLKKGRFF